MTVKSTPRPRNRKAQILAIARAQFARNGYHGVSMDDIAAEAGITAGALYRHFPGKQDLLTQAITSNTALVLEALADVDPLDSSAIFLGFARYGLDQNVRSVLFDQEAHNLTPERRGEARAGVQSILDRVAVALRAERPDLPQSDIDLLAWALTSLATSAARHRPNMPRKRVEQHLVTMADAIKSTPALPQEDPPSGKPRGAGLTHISKRESLLSAAIAQMHQRGLQAITMEDIAVAAGMSRPGIYNYFASKSDILLAILARRTEILRFGLAQALADADTREDALAMLVRSYTNAVVAPDSAIGIFIEESTHLPEETRTEALLAQREYVEEWMNLLGSDSPEVRSTVLTTLSLINDLSRGPRQTRPRAIEALAHRVLVGSAPDLSGV